MRVYLIEASTNLPKIDLLSNSIQIFQAAPPSIKEFLVSNPSRADIFLVPHDASVWTESYAQLIESMSLTRPIVFFNRSDQPLVVKIKNSVSLQNAICLRQVARQVIVPYNILSLEHLQFREYTSRPTISFVGFVPKLTLGRLKTVSSSGFPRSIINNPVFVRRQGLRNIMKHFPNSIVINRSHYGGARSLISDPRQWRLEYVNSILESDFVFSPRGDANASQRYYEAISAGRIPLVPNTGQSFPKCTCGRKHHPGIVSISWTSKDIQMKVDSFWQNLTKNSYLDLQHELRRTYQECYSYQKYILRFFSGDFKSLDAFTY